MGSKKFEAYCKLFTYTKNKGGANINPQGVLHKTSFKPVFDIAYLNVLFSLC